MMHSMPDIYSDACLVVIVTGLICATIRLCHMCRPFDKEKDYFYPARIQVSAAYASIALLMIPYWLDPMNDAVMLAVRIAGIVFYPICFSLLFGRYFEGRRRHAPLYLAALSLTFTALLALIVLAVCLPEKTFAAGRALMAAGGVLSIAFSVELVRQLGRIRRRINNFHQQNFSNEDDFPYRFAEKVIFLPVIWIVLEWVIFISGSRDIKAILDLLFSVAMVALLCAVLHPQKPLRTAPAEREADLHQREDLPELARPVEEFAENIEDEEDDAELEAAFHDEDTKKRVLEIIGRRFREPHLQKKDVLAEIERGKVHQANLFIRSVGYYNLINMFRLEYARQYAAANPNFKQAVIAQASGFSSGSSFSKAKKSVADIDPELVREVHI